MIAAFDVHYMKNHRASVAAVLFSDYSTAVPKNVFRKMVPVSAGYIPGEFYKRELPCILSLLEQISQHSQALLWISDSFQALQKFLIFGGDGPHVADQRITIKATVETTLI